MWKMKDKSREIEGRQKCRGTNTRTESGQKSEFQQA